VTASVRRPRGGAEPARPPLSPPLAGLRKKNPHTLRICNVERPTEFACGRRHHVSDVGLVPGWDPTDHGRRRTAAAQRRVSTATYSAVISTDTEC